jgi:uncharacterized protein YllA (UPF0747 family)
LTTISKFSIWEKSGLWPDFLVSVFEGNAAAFGLPFSSDMNGLRQAAEKRSLPMERRLLLKNVLLKQNEQALLSYPKIKENIEALADENSLTITTGHQLSLAGGPLFLWYKLCTLI